MRIESNIRRQSQSTGHEKRGGAVRSTGSLTGGSCRRAGPVIERSFATPKQIEPNSKPALLTDEHSMRRARAPFNSTKSAQARGAESVNDAPHVLGAVAWTDQNRIRAVDHDE